jgi:hypothetical protein
MTEAPQLPLTVTSESAQTLGPLSVEVIPESGDNIQEFALSSAHQKQVVFVSPGRYALLARRPNGERLYRSVTVSGDKPAIVNFAEGLPVSPNKFMLHEASRGEVAFNPSVGKAQPSFGLVRGYAGRTLQALNAIREATPTSTKKPKRSVWTLQVWGSSQAIPPLTYDSGKSFLKVKVERNCIAIGLLDGDGFGPIVMTPPFRRPLHITFLAEGLTASVGSRHLNPSGKRVAVALVTPEEASVADLLTTLGSLGFDQATALWEQNRNSPTNARDFVHAKYDYPTEALLGAHYLLRFLPNQLPLAWADNLQYALPHAADGPVIAAWLRITSSAKDVQTLDPEKLNEQVRRLLEYAITRPITWFARTRRLLVDGLRLKGVISADWKFTERTPDPATYLDYGAGAGGIEAFWGTHPFSPGPTVRLGAPPSSRIASFALEGNTFAGEFPTYDQTSTRSVRSRKGAKRAKKPVVKTKKASAKKKKAPAKKKEFTRRAKARSSKRRIKLRA